MLSRVFGPAFIPTAQQGADAWAAGVQAGASKYTQNVQNTTKDVVGLAIAQQSVLVANFNNAVNSGLWARRLGEVGTNGWKSATVAKAANYVTGATAGKSKYQDAATQLYPYIAQGEQQVSGMPSGTLADSIARATFWINYMAAYKQLH
jgi:hypothetical protein